MKMNSSALLRVHTIVSEMNSQAYNEGIRFEQARIVKLLIQQGKDGCHQKDCQTCDDYESTMEHLIKQIQGED
jgi:hypothetical protein